MAFTKTGTSKETGSAATGLRSFATHSAEVDSPETKSGATGKAADKQRQDGLIIALAFAVAAFAGWRLVAGPWLQAAISRPTPLREALLPHSGEPVYVVAGVGVGWFWVLFIAAPVAALTAGLAGCALAGWANRRTRMGHHGQLRAGQRWPGHHYPKLSHILLATAVTIASAGALLRWAGPAATTIPGRLLLVGAWAAMGCGLYQFIRWANARSAITGQINTASYLLASMLGWTDYRSGRVRDTQRRYPNGSGPYASIITLRYNAAPLSVGADLTRHVADVLQDITGRTYTVQNEAACRTLIATETTVIDEAVVVNAETVLCPLVGSWFDAAAQIRSVHMSERDTCTDTGADGTEPSSGNGGEAFTASDDIARDITEFTVEFAYNMRVSTAYRRGVIEGCVSDALGGSWEAQWSMPSRRVRFLRSPGLPTLADPPLDFPTVTRASIRSAYQKTIIPFGVDAYGNTISWDYRLSPHMLAAGATSTGKTSLLMTIATQCARRGFNVVWIDPKGFDSPGMRNWPNVSLVTAGTDEDGLVGHTAAIRFLADTMTARLSQVKINPNRADDFDPIFVITDEFSNLCVALTEFFGTYRVSWEKGTPPTQRDVGVLLRTARAVGIHMAIGIQRPDALFIAGEARDNTTLRVAMGRLRSKDAAIMMFNDAVAGTRLQPGIKGRGTVQLPDGSFREMQAFYTPKVPATPEQDAALSAHERGILEALSDVDSFWPRRVVNNVLRYYDPEDEEQRDRMCFKLIRESPIVLASSRPDLDPLSPQYVVPNLAVRRPTMDDDHTDVDQDDEVDQGAGHTGAGEGGPSSAVTFAAPVDGYADDYMPGIDDEYQPAVALMANELCHGDLVDVSFGGVRSWRYIHADPYPSDDEHGNPRWVIPYRDIDGGNAGDVEVDPNEVFQARQLQMN